MTGGRRQQGAGRTTHADRAARSRIGAALVPALTLTLGVAGVGVATAFVTASPAAAAAAERSWGAPEPLTEAGVHNSAEGLITTSDGTVVTVWVRGEAGSDQELWAATRAADVTAWSAPVRVTEARGPVYGVDLVAGADGTATVAWLHYGPTGYTYSSSTLPAQGGA